MVFKQSLEAGRTRLYLLIGVLTTLLTVLGTLLYLSPGHWLLDHERNRTLAEVLPATYVINTTAFDKTTGRELGGGLGAGVLIDDRGYILTVAHMVKKDVDPEDVQSAKISSEEGPEVPPKAPPRIDPKNIEFRMSAMDMHGQEYRAHVVAKSRFQSVDLALLKITAPKLAKPVVLADPDSIRFDSVLVIGTPRGLAFTVTEGIISMPERSVGFFEIEYFVQFDAPIQPGNSGGPVIRLSDGKLVGITTSCLLAAENSCSDLAFAVPPAVIKEWLAKNLPPRQRPKSPPLK